MISFPIKIITKLRGESKHQMWKKTLRKIQVRNKLKHSTEVKHDEDG